MMMINIMKRSWTSIDRSFFQIIKSISVRLRGLQREGGSIGKWRVRLPGYRIELMLAGNPGAKSSE